MGKGVKGDKTQHGGPSLTECLMQIQQWKKLDIQYNILNGSSK